MTGKTVLITGATSGMGKAMELANMRVRCARPIVRQPGYRYGSRVFEFEFIPLSPVHPSA